MKFARLHLVSARSFWDAGGIRWKAGGKEKVYSILPALWAVSLAHDLPEAGHR